MEKVSITVSIEKERLEALTFYLHRKEQTTPLKVLEKMLMEMTFLKVGKICMRLILLLNSLT